MTAAERVERLRKEADRERLLERVNQEDCWHDLLSRVLEEHGTCANELEELLFFVAIDELRSTRARYRQQPTALTRQAHEDVANRVAELIDSGLIDACYLYLCPSCLSPCDDVIALDWRDYVGFCSECLTRWRQTSAEALWGEHPPLEQVLAYTEVEPARLPTGRVTTHGCPCGCGLVAEVEESKPRWRIRPLTDRLTDLNPLSLVEGAEA